MENGRNAIKKVLYWLNYVGRIISYLSRIVRDFPLPDETGQKTISNTGQRENV